MDRAAEGLSVMVTGAAGNLGGRLVSHLERAAWCARVVAADRNGETLSALYGASSKVETCVVDLTRPSDRLTDLVGTVDTIVHLAVTNVLPDSTWEEGVHSFDMTANLLVAAREKGVRRFVFASSNHTLGRYKESPLVEALTPGCLTTSLFAPGTRWEMLDGEMVGYAYGAAKIFGERLCVAAASPGGLSAVAIRIGWCQGGDNHPSTINAAGNPQLTAAGRASKGSEAELRWFRNMWLSTPDFLHLFERAILADEAPWPAPGIVINGMSANTGMAWEIETARQTIGYQPADNVWDHV
jgi:nucleoside-diphosphate-sugar epimerase